MSRGLHWRRGLTGALTGLLLLSPAASSAGGAAYAAPLARSAAVPWRQVGPGWALAISWPGIIGSSGPRRAAVPVLYLYSPAGTRYRLFRWPRTKLPPVLLDWSGDKTRALVSTGSGALDQIVLAKGEVSHLRLPRQAQPIGYTRPTGQEVLTSQSVGPHFSHFRLARYHLDGKLAQVLTSVADGDTTLYSSSGAELAVNAPHGIWMISNNGGIRRRLPVPGAGAGCNPSRWWNGATILAYCKAASKARSRLWLVPAAGAKPRPLTAQYGKNSIDPGDFGAWSVRGSLYLNAQAPSGRQLIFRRTAGRPLRPISVPHVPPSDLIVATHGSRLLIIAFQDCSTHASLLWLNPVTGQEQLLINARPALAGVLGEVSFDQPVGGFGYDVFCTGVKRMDQP
jgi:TolB protein